jgi:hypothetical protein
MKVKLHTILANAETRGFPGDIVDVPESQAKQLIAGKYAEAVQPPPVKVPAAAEQPAGGTQPQSPAAGGAAGSEITTLENMSIAKVLAAIEAGQLTRERALELEQAGKKRPSLIAQLSEPAA